MSSTRRTLAERVFARWGEDGGHRNKSGGGDKKGAADKSRPGTFICSTSASSDRSDHTVSDYTVSDDASDECEGVTTQSAHMQRPPAEKPTNPSPRAATPPPETATMPSATRAAAHSGSVSQADVRPVDAPPVRLLVVGEDDEHAATIELLLKQITTSAEGFGLSQQLHVEYADCGDDAWKLLRLQHFDIAIIDLSMQGSTSGLELSWNYQLSVGEQRSEGSPNWLPTVMVACSSGELSEPALRHDCYNHGIQDLLPKPVTERALRQVLHKWLPQRCSCSPKAQPRLEELRRRHCSKSPLRAGSSLSTLPRSVGDTEATVPATTHAFHSRVMHVEPCSVTASATRTLFQELDMWIDSCGSAEEAMPMLAASLEQTSRLDLILLEVELPGISGYALCSWYRQLCQERGVAPATVVALTAEPDPCTCREFGIDRCLPKPLTPSCVAEMVSQWLSSPRPSLHSSPPPSPVQSAAPTTHEQVASWP